MKLQDLQTDDRPDEGRAPRTKHVVIRAIVAAIILAIVGMVDKVTGPHVSVLAFYTIPVVIATLSIGRLAGIVFSIAAAAMWLAVELTDSRLGCWLDVWNATMRLAVFLLIAILISLLQRRKKELTKLRDSLPW